jgi:SAM-dependent methyltransferase
MSIQGNIKYLWDRLTASDEVRKQEVHFRCNICGRITQALPQNLTREAVTCRCGSTVRLRSLAHVLSVNLFGKSLAIPEMPLRPDLIGVDMSGSELFATRLAQRIGYTNTFLHKEPRLNIIEPTDAWLSRCGFVISSDVFEHVTPPVSRAFENTLRILKPGGVLVLTVPYTLAPETVEHFPELNDYRIEMRDGRKVLVNRTKNGVVQETDKLVFHGGEGETLELRVFSEKGVLMELERAGFTDIQIHREPYPEFGITWSDPWSLPISARRP